jgi:hypothetical protein
LHEGRIAKRRPLENGRRSRLRTCRVYWYNWTKFRSENGVGMAEPLSARLMAQLE